MLATALIVALTAPALPSYCTDEDDGRRVFGLVVGYNGTRNPKNRPLQFADDDAARAAEWLSGLVCSADDLEVLTEPDDTTRATFEPTMLARVRPPVLEQLRAAVASLADRIRDARAQRRPTEIYVQYAGHGDLEDGLTSLTLADHMLTAAELEDEVLAVLEADRIHLIVDACNAGYLLAPRGAQRQMRLEPSVEGVREFFERRPNVGVVLSTSKAEKSYEDARYESGIFSHVVRSGLLGGADADLDHRVSYGELNAFLSAAFSRVRPALYRPEVFVAAPGRGDPRLALVEDIGRPLVQIDDALAGHFFLEDDRRVRHADVHKPAGRRVALAYPTPVAKGFSLKKIVDEGLGAFVREGLGLPSAAVEVQHLEGRTERLPSRGGDQRDYEGLFDEPFDPADDALTIVPPIEQAVPDAAVVWGPSLSFGLEQGVIEGVRLLPELVDVGVRGAFDRWSLEARFSFAFENDAGVDDLAYDFRRFELTLSPRYGLPIVTADNFAILLQGGVDVAFGLETQSGAMVASVGQDGVTVVTNQSFDGLTQRTSAVLGVLFLLTRSIEVAVEAEAGARLVQLRDPGTDTTRFEPRRAFGGRVALYYVLW